MYCGNNRRNPDVLSGQKIIGNRYGCFKQGIGIGRHLPYDPAYGNRFVPVDSRKIYCGKAKVIPAGYDYMGSNTMCLQKGVGVGKAITAKEQRKGKKAVKKSPKKAVKPKTKKTPKKQNARN